MEFGDRVWANVTRHRVGLVSRVQCFPQKPRGVAPAIRLWMLHFGHVFAFSGTPQLLTSLSKLLT